MELLLVKKGNAFYPEDSFNEQQMQKLKNGQSYWLKAKKERNPDFHRKFFALLNFGYQHTRLKNIEFGDYRAYITMKAGFYKIYNTPKGQMVLPKSIAFDKMDDIEFENLYNKALDVIAEDIQTDKDTILNELMAFI